MDNLNIWLTFVKLIVALPLVLILVVVVLRYGTSEYRSRSRTGLAMQVVDRVSLNARTAVYVLKVQEQYYVIGSQDNHMILLDKLHQYNAEKLEQFPVQRFETLFLDKLQLAVEKMKGAKNKKKGTDESDD